MVNKKKGKYYVYFHRCVKTDEILYVGKGSADRFRAKNSGGRFNIRSRRWEEKVGSRDYYPDLVHFSDDESYILRIERKIISRLSPIGNSVKSNPMGNKTEMSSLLKKVWKCRSKEEKDRLLAIRVDGTKKWWASIPAEEKSRIQSERAKKRILKKVLNKSTGEIYNSAREASKKLGCAITTVRSICGNSNLKSFKGIQLEYTGGGL